MRLTIWLMILIIYQASSLTAQAVNEKEQEKFYFGYDIKIIQEVGGSFNTIKIALESFSKKINSEFELKWCKTTDELVNQLDEGKVVSASLMPLTYIFSEKKNIKPLVGAIAAYSEDIYIRYVVLVRNDSGIENLSQIGGKQFARHKGEEVGGLYLNTELAKTKMKTIEEVFGAIIKYDTQEECFYSVYFKKSQVCLVSDDTYNMLCELNPAIKSQMKILCKSEKYVVGGLFVNKNINANLEQQLIKTSLSMHEFASGRQTLRMMRIKKLVIIKDEYFESIRKLIAEYRELTNKDYKELYAKYQTTME